MQTRAIVFKKQNTNEYDQLITFYSEEFGRLTAIAKSILKPSSIQSLHLDVFNLVEFDLIDGKAMPIITGAQAEKTYPNLKSNLSKMAVAYFFTEAADKLFFDYQRDEDVWDFFTSLFDQLEKTQLDIDVLFKKKQTEFLNIMGYAPDFNVCTFCGIGVNGNPTAYSTEQKGIICKKCFLEGRRGVVMRAGDLNSNFITGIVFESFVEVKMHSSVLVNSFFKLNQRSNFI